MSGTSARHTSPGTSAAMAQPPQEISTPAASARFTASGLAAMAVMNMEEDTVVVWKQVSIRNEPIFLAVPFSGSEPHARHSALANGKKMPPARAATDGMAGESSASAMTSEYVRPSVVLPNALTMAYAMRLPRPDLMKPPARKYAIAMSHGISVANAEKASANVRTLVIIAAPSPRNATAPSGSGVVMIPTMVPVKSDSRCQALSDTPAGGGMNHMMVAMATQMPRFFMSAPHLNSAAGDEDDA
mmetsp:Transcript_45100/g.134648  ORF Transcript_45100/g.134648 Transcript_45100/m.134648 type:complete len:244 (-) Transcript_45100:312-1043(-)